MKKSIKEELEYYILEDRYRHNEIPADIGDLHNEIFNEDYYIIGYYYADQWLEKHRLSVFEAMAEVKDFEEMHFGEAKHYDNSEGLVNMLAYVYGLEVRNCNYLRKETK